MPYGNYAQLEQFSPDQYQNARLQEQQLQQMMQQRQAAQAQQMQQAQAQAQAQQAQAQQGGGGASGMSFGEALQAGGVGYFGGGPPPQAGGGAQQQQQSAMERFGGRFDEAMNNPMIAAALGAGSSMLSAADRGTSTVGALGTGVMGAFGGYAGARQRSKRQRQEEEERRRLMQAITGGFGSMADDGQLPQLSVYQAMMGGLGN